MRNVLEIVERLKQLYDVKTDTQLQDKTGIKTNTLRTWKERNSIPYKKLDEISQNESISMNWLLYGKGPVKMEECEKLNIDDQTDTHNQEEIINFLKELPEPTFKKIYHLAEIARLENK